jgi:hypothetical protein
MLHYKKTHERIPTWNGKEGSWDFLTLCRHYSKLSDKIWAPYMKDMIYISRYLSDHSKGKPIGLHSKVENCYTQNSNPREKDTYSLSYPAFDQKNSTFLTDKSYLNEKSTRKYFLCLLNEISVNPLLNMFPLPCAYLRLPWNPNSCYCRLIPTCRKNELSNNSMKKDGIHEFLSKFSSKNRFPYEFIVERMFVERILQSPSQYILRYVYIPSYVLLKSNSRDSHDKKLFEVGSVEI